jgi:hypothetical protein
MREDLEVVHESSDPVRVSRVRVVSSGREGARDAGDAR